MFNYLSLPKIEKSSSSMFLALDSWNINDIIAQISLSIKHGAERAGSYNLSHFLYAWIIAALK